MHLILAQACAVRGQIKVAFQHVSPIAADPGEGPLSEPIAVGEGWRWELVFMPEADQRTPDRHGLFFCREANQG
jgi:hypothetical protein